MTTWPRARSSFAAEGNGELVAGRLGDTLARRDEASGMLRRLSWAFMPSTIANRKGPLLWITLPHMAGR